MSQHIEGLSNTINDNNALLSRLAVFPQPDFPARTQDGLLEQLLRTKKQPDTEDWIEQGIRNSQDLRVKGGQQLSQAELESLWNWSPGALKEELSRYLPTFGTNFTLEEREAGIENVVTGLKRDLTASESDDEDSDEDVMDEDPLPVTTKPEVKATGPASDVNQVLKFLTTGILPATASLSTPSR